MMFLFLMQIVYFFHGSDIKNSAYQQKIGIFLGEFINAPPLDNEW